jgi:hypothetical protein
VFLFCEICGANALVLCSGAVGEAHKAEDKARQDPSLGLCLDLDYSAPHIQKKKMSMPVTIICHIHNRSGTQSLYIYKGQYAQK